jgi:23S rRNA pseudouridine2604 synthase
MSEHSYPVRINKYLAVEQYCTRRGADELVAAGRVLINGIPAVLGAVVQQGDTVEVRFRPPKRRYFAYHKPRGVITHSPQEDEEDIAALVQMPGLFPIGRLDKDSYGLIILTDDGRITDALLNPDRVHEKEYEVSTRDALPASFKRDMERGVDIGDYKTKPCTVEIIGKRKFSITLTEGKKHQIRRMCGAFGMSAIELKRVRIMNIELGSLKPGELRPLKGTELAVFLQTLGITR